MSQLIMSKGLVPHAIFFDAARFLIFLQLPLIRNTCHSLICASRTAFCYQTNRFDQHFSRTQWTKSDAEVPRGVRLPSTPNFHCTIELFIPTLHQRQSWSHCMLQIETSITQLEELRILKNGRMMKSVFASLTRGCWIWTHRKFEFKIYRNFLSVIAEF